MHSYLIPIAQKFREQADPVKAAGMKAYMRNQFDYWGLNTPLRRRLGKEYMKQALPAYSELPVLLKECWELPQREYQYFGMELLAACRKSWKKDAIRQIEYLLTHKSWWDTVDYIAGDLAGAYFRDFPTQILSVTGKWNRSDNIWLQRSSLLFQKSYKKETDTKLLEAYIRQLAGSKEFFVQKGIGWVLREYSKTNPRWVQQFVQKNPLAPLSKREAVKRMKEG